MSYAVKQVREVATDGISEHISLLSSLSALFFLSCFVFLFLQLLPSSSQYQPTATPSNQLWSMLTSSPAATFTALEPFPYMITHTGRQTNGNSTFQLLLKSLKMSRDILKAACLCFSCAHEYQMIESISDHMGEINCFSESQLEQGFPPFQPWEISNPDH